ncbi:MAG: 5-(carboxyamino)imidazole ribonucleotide mutase [Kiritimatiellia bacterium]
MDKSKIIDVGVIMGSDSDWPLLKQTASTLDSFGVGYEVHVMSAHRSPAAAVRFAGEAHGRGLKVIIAAAGCAAHLAGVLAAHTILPVIGVPVKGGALDGLDALLSTVQMPAGIPVATVALGNAGAVNAALLAVQMLALGNPQLAQRLTLHKKSLAEKVAAADEKLQAELTAARV